MNNTTGEAALSFTSLLGISATVLTAITTHSPAASLAVCALASISIAGMAWLIDQQQTSVAKNPASIFAKDSTSPAIPGANTEYSPAKPDGATLNQAKAI